MKVRALVDEVPVSVNGKHSKHVKGDEFDLPPEAVGSAVAAGIVEVVKEPKESKEAKEDAQAESTVKAMTPELQNKAVQPVVRRK